MFQYILQTDETNFKKLYKELTNDLENYIIRFYSYIEIMIKKKNYKIIF